MDNFFRVAKSIAMALVMFASALYLTANSGMAFILALMPLVLGLVGILVTPTYYFVASVFVAAVAWALVPTSVKTFSRDGLSTAIETVKGELSDSR